MLYNWAQKHQGRVCCYRRGLWSLMPERGWQQHRSQHCITKAVKLQQYQHCASLPEHTQAASPSFLPPLKEAQRPSLFLSLLQRAGRSMPAAILSHLSLQLMSLIWFMQSLSPHYHPLPSLLFLHSSLLLLLLTPSALPSLLSTELSVQWG